MNNTHVNKIVLNNTFPDDFLWGVATASYQVEGAVDEGGRSPSIWDTFSHTPGKTAHGHTGDISCDQYHRYTEDVELMRQLGIGSYRFSIAWPRILPDRKGSVNQAGADYYRRLIDTLLKAGIEPSATLYHWDLPQWLQDAGGWPSRDTAERFAEYADHCFRLFPEVTRWMTLNEPYCSAVLGHYIGKHAPGEESLEHTIHTMHHLLLGHGLALQAFRDNGSNGDIGIALNLAAARPATSRPEDIHAADRALDMQTRMFLDPLMGKGYPQRYLDNIPQISVPVQDGDMEIIGSRIDFLGLNYYSENAVRHDPENERGYSFAPSYQERTHMNWPIVPEGLYRHLRWVHAETGDLPLYITENGAAFEDTLDSEAKACHDPRRIEYIRSHLAACARAITDGVPLKGYFMWSFIDNFEWAYGYDKRFGIVYCDYIDQRRIPKDSYYFYRDVIAGTASVV